MAPPWLLVLLFACVVSTTHAVTCRHKEFGISVVLRPIDYETRTCEGDYCAATVNTTGHLQRLTCVNGTAFAGFNNRCWSTASDQSTIKCLCNDSNLCSDKPQILNAPGRIGKLNCGYSGRNCSSCEIKSYGQYTEEKCSVHLLEDDIDNILRPQSCVRIEGTELGNGYIRCVCDSASFCAEKIFNEQFLRSAAVTCLKGSSGDKTCMGSLCYIKRDFVFGQYRIDDRGCITNNETLYQGLYKVGLLRTNFNRDYAICNKSSCNVDWDTAMSNVSPSTTTSVPTITSVASTGTPTTQKPSTTTTVTGQTTTPASSISTSSPSKQAIFESEYIKFFSTMKQALDQFIGKLFELYR